MQTDHGPAFPHDPDRIGDGCGNAGVSWTRYGGIIRGLGRKAEYAKKVGQLTMQVEWLKKNLKKLSDLTTRVNLVRNLSTNKELPVSTGAKLLGINRTSVYYGGIPVSEEELECKSIIDHLHTDNPTWGARQMSAQLKLRGYQVGRRKAGRYMREMDITPIYPKMNLSTSPAASNCAIWSPIHLNPVSTFLNSTP